MKIVFNANYLEEYELIIIHNENLKVGDGRQYLLYIHYTWDNDKACPSTRKVPEKYFRMITLR